MIYVAYAVLAVLPLAFLAAMVKDIGVKGAMWVIGMGTALVALSAAFVWALHEVAVLS